MPGCGGLQLVATRFPVSSAWRRNVSACVVNAVLLKVGLMFVFLFCSMSMKHLGNYGINRSVRPHVVRGCAAN